MHEHMQRFRPPKWDSTFWDPSIFFWRPPSSLEWWHRKQTFPSPGRQSMYTCKNANPDDWNRKFETGQVSHATLLPSHPESKGNQMRIRSISTCGWCIDWRTLPTEALLCLLCQGMLCSEWCGLWNHPKRRMQGEPRCSTKWPAKEPNQTHGKSPIFRLHGHRLIVAGAAGCPQRRCEHSCRIWLPPHWLWRSYRSDMLQQKMHHISTYVYHPLPKAMWWMGFAMAKNQSTFPTKLRSVETNVPNDQIPHQASSSRSKSKRTCHISPHLPNEGANSTHR